MTGVACSAAMCSEICRLGHGVVQLSELISVLQLLVAVPSTCLGDVRGALVSAAPSTGSVCSWVTKEPCSRRTGTPCVSLCGSSFPGAVAVSLSVKPELPSVAQQSALRYQTSPVTWVKGLFRSAEESNEK